MNETKKILSLAFLINTAACNGQSSDSNYAKQGIACFAENHSNPITFNLIKKDKDYFIQITRKDKTQIICEESSLSFNFKDNFILKIAGERDDNNEGKISFKIDSVSIILLKKGNLVSFEFGQTLQVYDENINDVHLGGIYKYTKCIEPSYFKRNLK